MSALASLLNAPRHAMHALKERCTHTLVSDAHGGAFVVFGDAGLAARRLARSYFESDDTIKTRREFHGLDREAFAHASMVKHGMVMFTEAHTLPKLADNLLRMQSFVPLTIDIGESEEAYVAKLSKSSKDDARRARNRNFTVEIHRDATWAKEFHDRFHQPSISLRHGEDGFIADEREFVDLVKRGAGEFLCIVKEGVRVAAVLAAPEPASYRLHRLGWRDGDVTILKDGAIGAIYWYSLRRARELGKPRVTLGGTPPILEDGVTRYKLKWNPQVDPDFATPWKAQLLLLDPRHAHVQRMLARTSMVFQIHGASYFVLSGKSPSEAGLCEPMRRTLSAWYRFVPTPDPSRDSANATSPLPAQLRAWCINEPLLASARDGIPQHTP